MANVTLFFTNIMVSWISLNFLCTNDCLLINSGKVSSISPENSNFSWSVLALDGNNIVAGKTRIYFAQSVYLCIIHILVYSDQSNLNKADIYLFQSL